MKALVLAAMVAVTTLATAVADDAEAAKYAAIIVDAKTGKTLFSRNADAARYPASLTKMMTLFLTFEAIEQGRIDMSTRFRVSSQAAAQAPSKLGLKVNATIAVKDAIMALITKSANDVAVVLAEGLAGSESAFARKMTDRAHELGMSRTEFRNASGLPNPQQVTTARDMALLGRALQDNFPQYFKLFSTRSYTYAGHRLGNHNHLLGRVDGVDGIKTGYTRASGFNLVASVHRGQRSIVAVVMGGRTARSRDSHMTSIIGKYIARASTGPSAAPVLIASGKGSNPFRVSLDQVPLPWPKPDSAAAQVEVAANADTPAPGSIDQLVRQAQGDADDDAGSAVPDGWKIQIGALPSESAARDMIERARQAVPQLLAELSPYTEPVAKGSTTLYRARFAGFADREAARDVCTRLKREDFQCLALP